MQAQPAMLDPGLPHHMREWREQRQRPPQLGPGPEWEASPWPVQGAGGGVGFGPAQYLSAGPAPPPMGYVSARYGAGAGAGAGASPFHNHPRLRQHPVQSGPAGRGRGAGGAWGFRPSSMRYSPYGMPPQLTLGQGQADHSGCLPQDFAP